MRGRLAAGLLVAGLAVALSVLPDRGGRSADTAAPSSAWARAAPAAGGPTTEAAPDTGGASRDAGEVEIVRLDPRFDRLVPPGAAAERVAEGFDWVEGPLWHRRGGYLLFSDVPQNVIHRWDPTTGVRVFLERSGYSGAAAFEGREPGSNGLAWDPQGRLVFCQHGNRAIGRLERDGRRTVLVDRFEGRRLNSPNDLVFKSNGDLYFTDPPFGLPGAFEDPGKELEWQGVYRRAADGTLTLLTRALRAPNGLAFSPDESVLYVANADRTDAVWHAFPVRSDGTLGTGRILFDATKWSDRYAGVPDGLKVDRDGNLFAVGPGGVFVLAPDGTHLGTLVTGVATANVAWGGDGSDLYIAAGSTIHRLRTATAGARWTETGSAERSLGAGARRAQRVLEADLRLAQ